MRSLPECRNRCLIAIDVPVRPSDKDAIGRNSGGLGDDDGESYYAAPINIPTASTMAPPSTIWNTAWRNGVSM